MTIEGEKGSIKLLEGFRMVVTADGEATERSVGSPLLSWTAEPWHIAQESVLLTQRAIIAAWRAGRDAETSGRRQPKNLRGSRGGLRGRGERARRGADERRRLTRTAIFDFARPRANRPFETPKDLMLSRSAGPS